MGISGKQGAALVAYPLQGVFGVCLPDQELWESSIDVWCEFVLNFDTVVGGVARGTIGVHGVQGVLINGDPGVPRKREGARPEPPRWR